MSENQNPQKKASYKTKLMLQKLKNYGFTGYKDVLYIPAEKGIPGWWAISKTHQKDYLGKNYDEAIEKIKASEKYEWRCGNRVRGKKSFDLDVNRAYYCNQCEGLIKSLAEWESGLCNKCLNDTHKTALKSWDADLATMAEEMRMEAEKVEELEEQGK